MTFPQIEKTFKKKCSRCGSYKTDVKGNFGHSLCNRCARIKHLSKCNSLSIPVFLVKKFGFKNVQLFLEDTQEGILIRKARADEI